MKLNPENPTPGTPSAQPPINPVTTLEVLELVEELLRSIDALESTVFKPNASRVNYAWRKLNALRSRL